MSSLTQVRLADTTLVNKRQIFESIKNQDYRFAFVPERVRSSVALQIRALREQRNHMTQRQLGEALGMAQTWVSKLENPDYGKMSVATLLRLAEAFDTDLEIKFRPFSTAINTLPEQGSEYFTVPSFEEEEAEIEADLTRQEAAQRITPVAQGNALKHLASVKPVEDLSWLGNSQDVANRIVSEHYATNKSRMDYLRPTLGQNTVAQVVVAPETSPSPQGWIEALLGFQRSMDLSATRKPVKQALIRVGAAAELVPSNQDIGDGGYYHDAGKQALCR